MNFNYKSLIQLLTICVAISAFGCKRSDKQGFHIEQPPRRCEYNVGGVDRECQKRNLQDRAANFSEEELAEHRKKLIKECKSLDDKERPTKEGQTCEQHVDEVIDEWLKKV